jgi:DNA-binding transcriptional MerR regulator
MIRGMTIGQLAARTGMSVRTLRFYADAGVLPVAGRSDSGYRLFGADAVARARLVRTLRQLGVGLDDVKCVLGAEISLADVATAHANALDAQIRALRLQRAMLRAVAKSTDPSRGSWPQSSWSSRRLPASCVARVEDGSSGSRPLGTRRLCPSYSHSDGRRGVTRPPGPQRTP